MDKQTISENIGTVRHIQELIMIGEKETALLILNRLEDQLLTEYKKGE